MAENNMSAADYAVLSNGIWLCTMINAQAIKTLPKHKHTAFHKVYKKILINCASIRNLTNYRFAIDNLTEIRYNKFVS